MMCPTELPTLQRKQFIIFLFLSLCLSLSLSLYIYIYIYMRVCVCVCCQCLEIWEAMCQKDKLGEHENGIPPQKKNGVPQTRVDKPSLFPGELEHRRTTPRSSRIGSVSLTWRGCWAYPAVASVSIDHDPPSHNTFQTNSWLKRVNEVGTRRPLFGDRYL